MKKIVIFLMAGLALNLFSQNNDKTQKNYSDPYMLGVAISRNVNQYKFTDKEKQQIIKGFTDGIYKKVDYKNISYDKINNFVDAKRKLNVKDEKEKGQKYLEKFVKEKKAKKYESGLVMLVLREGNGPQPKSDDTVKVHYRGYFVDGKEFDSSYERKQPVEFKLNQVIPCWTEALQKMKVGSKVTIGCPSDIAYGDNGRPPVIPGGATLMFDIELLDIAQNNSDKK